jgi:hypothetical protein
VSPHTIRLENIVRSNLLIADIHAGSYYAPAGRKKITTKDGGYHPAMKNRGQKTLFKIWNKMLGIADEFHVDTVFIVGDVGDGCNPKERGKGEMTTDMDVQRLMAVDLLKPLVTGRKVHTFSGSPYHQSIDMSFHNTLADNLRDYAKESRFHGVIGNLAMKPSKLQFQVSHKVSNAMLYTATMLDREHVYQKFREAIDKEFPRIDIKISAHLHHFRHIDFGYMRVVQLPAWKAWYPIQKSTRLYGKVQPDIGFVIILIDDNNRSFILPFLWTAPRIVDTLTPG